MKTCKTCNLEKLEAEMEIKYIKICGAVYYRLHCKNCWINISNCNTKICSNCGEEKLLNEMALHHIDEITGKIYYRGRCKNCYYKLSLPTRMLYEEKNKEKRSEYKKQYDEENSVENQEYRDSRKDKKKEYDKQYADSNREELKIKRRERKKNKLKTDPAYKMRESVSRSVNNIIKKQGKVKSGSVWNVLDYTPQELRNHLEKQFEKWMTWQNHGIYNSKTWDDNDSTTWTWQLDHFPIAQINCLYDSLDHPNLKICWALNNLRPLNAKQNIINGIIVREKRRVKKITS